MKTFAMILTVLVVLTGTTAINAAPADPPGANPCGVFHATVYGVTNQGIAPATDPIPQPPVNAVCGPGFKTVVVGIGDDMVTAVFDGLRKQAALGVNVTDIIPTTVDLDTGAIRPVNSGDETHDVTAPNVQRIYFYAG